MLDTWKSIRERWNNVFRVSLQEINREKNGYEKYSKQYARVIKVDF